jgi:flagellar biogenesis protein FliO
MIPNQVDKTFQIRLVSEEKRMNGQFNFSDLAWIGVLVLVILIIIIALLTWGVVRIIKGRRIK